MNIKNLPLQDRPRDRLIQQGAKQLTDAELLAIFLRTGSPGKNALTLAQELLQHYQGLQPLLQTSAVKLCTHKGIGPSKYCQLQAAAELGRRLQCKPVQIGDTLDSVNSALGFLQARIGSESRENFFCIYCDVRHRVIAMETLFSGTVNAATVYPREVVRQGLVHNAVAILIAHNHPSGNTTPSDMDLEITKRLKKALELVEIRLLDHLIITTNGYASLKELGIIR